MRHLVFFFFLQYTKTKRVSVKYLIHQGLIFESTGWPSFFFFSPNFRIDSRFQYNTEIVSGNFLLNAFLTGCKRSNKDAQLCSNTPEQNMLLKRKKNLFVCSTPCNLKEYLVICIIFFLKKNPVSLLAQKAFYYAHRKFQSYIVP